MHVYDECSITDFRNPGYDINNLISGRWSPRSMDASIMEEKELMPLFEAARWAPSSSNSQPWKFLYAGRDSKDWQVFFDLLVEFNQIWAKNASVLLLLLSEKYALKDHSPLINHQFDAGAAWQNFALEARNRNLVAHAMGGFDRERARNELHIPDNYEINIMIAVGKAAPKSVLPDFLQAMEKPNTRKNISEIIHKGVF
jgi:nitroreductase